MIPHRLGGFYRADDPGEPSSLVPRVSIADDERAVLAGIVAGMSVLEIGTGLGVSTRAMAATASRVTTVDIDEWVHGTIWPDLPDNVGCSSSTDKLVGPFDVVFIDGDHSETALRSDIATGERLAPGGLLVVHDAEHLKRHLGDGWEFIPTTYGLATRRVG